MEEPASTDRSLITEKKAEKQSEVTEQNYE